MTNRVKTKQKKRKKRNLTSWKNAKTAPYEMLCCTILLFYPLLSPCYPVLDLQVLKKTSSWKPQSDEKTQQTDYTDKTGVIILNLDNRQSCHVIPMQLHCMTQQLLKESNSTGMTVL